MWQVRRKKGEKARTTDGIEKGGGGGMAESWVRELDFETEAHDLISVGVCTMLAWQS